MIHICCYYLSFFSFCRYRLIHTSKTTCVLCVGVSLDHTFAGISSASSTFAGLVGNGNTTLMVSRGTALLLAQASQHHAPCKTFFNMHCCTKKVAVPFLHVATIPFSSANFFPIIYPICFVSYCTKFSLFNCLILYLLVMHPHRTKGVFLFIVSVLNYKLSLF